MGYGSGPRRTKEKSIVEAETDIPLVTFVPWPLAYFNAAAVDQAQPQPPNRTYCYLPNATPSWFIFSLSSQVSFILIHWVFVENCFVLSVPLSTPLVRNKSSSTLCAFATRALDWVL